MLNLDLEDTNSVLCRVIEFGRLCYEEDNTINFFHKNCNCVPVWV